MEAEQEYQRLVQTWRQLESRATLEDVDHLRRLFSHCNRIVDFIYETPAAGLRGALLKLRHLTDPNQPMNFDAPEEETAVHDVMAVIERTLGVESVPRPAIPFEDYGKAPLASAPGGNVVPLLPRNTGNSQSDPSDEPGPDAA